MHTQVIVTVTTTTSMPWRHELGRRAEVATPTPAPPFLELGQRTYVYLSLEASSSPQYIALAIDWLKSFRIRSKITTVYVLI